MSQVGENVLKLSFLFTVDAGRHFICLQVSTSTSTSTSATSCLLHGVIMASPMNWQVDKAPKSAAASGGTSEDLTARMQHMIDLQHQQSSGSAGTATTSSTLGGPAEETSLLGTGTTTTTLGAKSLSRSVGLSSLHTLQKDTTITSNNYLSEESTMMMEPGVGRGTLYFNSEKLGSAASAATQSVRSEEEANQSNIQRRMLLPTNMNKNKNNVAGSGEQQSYGAIKASAHSSLPENPHHYQSQQQHKQNLDPQGLYPPYHDHYDFAAESHPARQQQQQQRNNSQRSFLSLYCSYVWKLFYMLLCCCSLDAVEEQALHRSFCFGAIDGMLTGSGIVAAFVGMSILAPTSTFCIRSFVVAFSASACFADSLCMALGHVWTTHVLVTASARERTDQRKAMETNPVTAKGKLVDLLLERGMLKIDAMSLADTLEGYPDLFVSALVGDALVAGGVSGQHSHNTYTTTEWSSSMEFNGPNSNRSQQHFGSGDDTSNNQHIMFWKFPSYGQHIDELDHEIEPEESFVSSAMTESRREGLFMMMGFSMFAILPSLIYLVIPMMTDPPSLNDHYKSSAPSSALTHVTDDSVEQGSTTSATSMVITTAAAIMWCLGVWKSRFLDSNWMVFGIETVVVLLVCISAAFGLGVLLRALFPGLTVTIDSASILDSSPSFV
jgi:VIT family